MWPTLSDLLGALRPFFETMAQLVWNLITDLLKAIVGLLINDSVFNDVVSYVSSIPYLYVAGGVAFAAVARKLIFTAEKLREATPIGVAVAWTEDVILSANLIWYLRGAIIPLVFFPIILLISVIVFIKDFPTIIIAFIVKVFEAILEFALKLVIALFELVFNMIKMAIDVVTGIVEGIADLCDDIFEALP